MQSLPPPVRFPSRRLLVRRFPRLTRSPIAYWLVVVVLALLTGMVAARVVGNAGALAAQYGPLRPVVVADGAAPTFPVALGALVVDVGDESAAVAVTPDEAARVAFALTSGAVTLALASPADDDPGNDAGLSGSSSPPAPAPPDPPSPGR